MRERFNNNTFHLPLMASGAEPHTGFVVTDLALFMLLCLGTLRKGRKGENTCTSLVERCLWGCVMNRFWKAFMYYPKGHAPFFTQIEPVDVVTNVYFLHCIVIARFQLCLKPAFAVDLAPCSGHDAP